MLDGFVDIHTHVLPGIDDGPADLEGALALARAARDAGTTTLVATPHLRSDFPDVHVRELTGRCDELRATLEREGVQVQLVSGAEVSLVWALDASPEELELASYGQHGKDLLIESPASVVTGLDELLYQLRARGFRVTLAHPERSQEFQSDPSRLEELVRQGVLLQVNAEDLVGRRRGSPVLRTARQLCRDGLAHVIASDGHRASSWRPVSSMADAVSAAAELVGEDEAIWMARDVPAAIIAGADLPERPARRAGGRIRRLFRAR